MMVKSQIEAQIGLLLDSTASLSLEEAKSEFKSQLAELIVDAIKSATITIPSGAINVVGSPSAQSNAVPVILNNSLT
jgi:hypothetical protein